MMSTIFEKESVQNLKNGIERNKKLFFIKDMDKDCIFLIQI